jgi:uncharacterized protein (TIGR03086 family)
MSALVGEGAAMQTTTDTNPTDDADGVPAPLGADDPRRAFASAVATGTATVGAVRDDQLGLPTPCTEMDVEALLAHLRSVLDRVAALGHGEDPFAVVEAPLGPDRLAEWTEAAHRVQAAWTNDAVLERPMALPWQQGAGADILLGYINEVVVHTWDLAAATGQQPEWDEAVLRVALERMPGLPAEGRRELFEQISADMGLPEVAMPFGEVVPVPDGAPLIERLVGWNGRDPRWGDGRS